MRILKQSYIVNHSCTQLSSPDQLYTQRSTLKLQHFKISYLVWQIS